MKVDVDVIIKDTDETTMILSYEEARELYRLLRRIFRPNKPTRRESETIVTFGADTHI